MATMRNTATVTQTDDFGTPDEFIAEDSTASDSTASSSSNGSSFANSTLSLDQMNEVTFNDDRDEQELAKLNPPTGDWKKSDRWALEQKNIRVNLEDCIPGDIDTTGRTTITFIGKPDARSMHGIDYQPVLFLRVSPDMRRKKDKPEEVDMAYKLFLKAKELYITMHGEKPRTLKQLLAMLEEDSYIIRTMNGDSGPIVVDIKVERPRR